MGLQGSAWAWASPRWSKRKAGSERWVRPMLLAEVTFAEWTPDGQARHSAFIGLRDDKPAQAIKVIDKPDRMILRSGPR
ncbi:MAG TPA: hypothetical protein VFI87_15370 [Hyphomicrobiaceae bacterium]|nr:hypothetical protein [Hyphomicrobiaceae bacterium]